MTIATDKARAAFDAGNIQLALDTAGTAANAGDADALTLIAEWLLVGGVLTRDLPKARDLLRQARERGSEDAAITEVALTANGTGAAPDWNRALALLRDAASRYGGFAAEDLALITAMDLDELGFPKSLPKPEFLGSSYQVRHWRALFSPPECAHIAMSVRDLLAPSAVADPRTGRTIAHPIRTSSAAVIGPTRESLTVQALLRRIAAATDTRVDQGEPLSVLHYAPGQQYRPHLDTLPNEPNQRIKTALVYLNTGYAGGETAFPDQNIVIRAGGGDLVTFDNVLPDGRPDPRSRHAGLPVSQGAKWAATRWIRAEAIDIWNPPAPV